MLSPMIPSRLEHALRWLDKNPQYYFNELPAGLGFETIDGKEWYCFAGNHRMIVAKYLFALIESKCQAPHS